MRTYPAKDIKRGRMSWLIYGKSRAGKTALIGTFRPPIVITNFPNENGVVTLMGHSEVTVYEIEKVQDAVDFPTWVFEENKRRVEAGLEPFGTVAVDSLTSWLELYQQELGHSLRIPTDLPLIAKWSQEITLTVDRLRPLDAEKVFTANLSLNKDEVTGEQHGGPDLFKSLASRLPRKVDATVIMESGSTLGQGGIQIVTRKAWLISKDGMPGGIRGACGAPFVEEPSYSKILAEMGGALFD